LGGSVTIFPLGSTSYILEPGSLVGPSFTLNPAVSTTYSISAISPAGCVSTNTVYTTITVNPKPVVGFASITNTNICVGALSVITPSGAATYTLMPGGLTGISFIVTPTVPTTYTITGMDISSAPSCTNLAVTTISVVPPMLPTIAASNSTVCLNRTVDLIGSPNIPGYTYAWTPVASIQGSANTYSAVAKPLSVGNTIYTLAVSNGTCTETQTVSIGVIKCSAPVLTFTTITSNSICTNGCVTFSASATGTPQPITYEWTFENGNPAAATTATAQVCYTLAGTYSISVKAKNVYGSDSIIKLKYVEVTDMPTVVTAFGDTTLKIGQTKQIWATGSKYYHWYPDDKSVACPTCSMTTVQPSVTTRYIVVGSNSSACSLMDTVLIKVDFICGDFFVPNAFSPNGDGKNDDVNVHGFCIKNYKFQIFNRWGEMVFETNDRNLSWDGNHRGKPLDTGVFIYRAEGETIDGKPFSIKGNITLLR
jgi:gliding motility-associated-like protein